MGEGAGPGTAGGWGRDNGVRGSRTEEAKPRKVIICDKILSSVLLECKLCLRVYLNSRLESSAFIFP